ncbi:MAG: hypothetical protein ABI234_12600 [Ktedonobacteraceae bacterium]
MSYSVDFPPFPTMGARGPQVCAAVRFYLAIADDLSFEQIRILTEHLQDCPDCVAEFRLLRNTTRLVAALPASIPSARVDKAIRATLTNRISAARQFDSERRTDPHVSAFCQRRRAISRRGPRIVALAAVFVLLLLTGVFLHGLIFPTSNNMAFQLPSNLSWNGYVLHYTQNRLDTQKQSYQVEVYQDLSTDQMHVESSMPGQFDVVVVTTPTTMLGKDMMNNVAQEGHAVAGWSVDGSLFVLTQLRQNLATRHAIYLGQRTFQGQQVYQIRVSNGQVLLLNMHYLPVGALQSTGALTYDTCTLMPTTQVSDSMWDMSVPPNFRMGQLPSTS